MRLLGEAMPKSITTNIYLDDTSFQFQWNGTLEMYMMCGYTIPAEKEKDFNRAISRVKKKYGISDELPIKWNLKRLRDFYADRGESAKLERLLREADELRLEIFDILAKEDYSIVLYASAVARLLPKKKPKDSYQRCFANLLQRVAQNLTTSERLHHLYVDFMKEDSDNIAACFASCYHRGIDLEGNSFFSGPLLGRGMSQCLYFGKTRFNPFIQVADLITGCASDFFEFCFCDKGFDRVTKLFPKIMRRFCWDDAADSPLKRGIVVAPGTMYPRIQKGYSKVIAAI